MNVARNFIIFLLTVLAFAQAQYRQPSWSSHIVMPQTRAFAVDHQSRIHITGVNAGVVIIEQAATVTMDISLRNDNHTRQQAELIVPVPTGAVVKGFTFQGAGKEPMAQLLPKNEARKIYDAIVAKVRDPALLEFVGYNLIRSSVFPVEPHGNQKVRLTYEHLLPADGNRIDFVLPRSESLDYHIPWKITVSVQAKKTISTVYSPSHKIETRRKNQMKVTAQLTGAASTDPGPFRLSYLLEDQGITASLFAYPDPKINGGYFLLLGGLPADIKTSKNTIKREIILVIDRSGSMRGAKIRQVKEAARQILGGMKEGEFFNIIVYNQGVETFAPRPVVKNSQTEKLADNYLQSISPNGGTNIHDALLESLRLKPAEQTLPMVLFLTDGLPTIGQTSETAIRNTATKANRYRRRIFTFGVGVDVNTPLLEKVAYESRGTATFVLPKEDVELKVASVYKRLSGPVLADPNLSIVDAKGKIAPGRVHDIIPGKLPDLFKGDQLVLLGCYIGEKPVNFKISGNYLGQKRSFHYRFDFTRATTRNSFVPRLWASRKIAMLIDSVRYLGADSSPFHGRRNTANDPRLKELVNEIVRLSTEFGILTEYTAFLAREGVDLSDHDKILSEAQKNFKNRAWYSRSGMSSVNQDINAQYQKKQARVNPRNAYWDRRMNRVAITQVQQMNDRAFYKRGSQWIDSRLLTNKNNIKPSRVIHFGSAEFQTLAALLVKQGRQGCISLDGDIVIIVDGQVIMVKAPELSKK